MFRTPACVEEYFATSNAKQAAEEMWSPRLSSSERCRRILGQTISRALTDDSASGISRISEFAELQTAFDSDFLRREEPSWVRKQKLKVHRGGYGARAMSDHHWMEEWIQITDRYLFFHNPEKQKPHFRISLQSIVDVKCLPSADAPVMSSYCFIAVATLGTNYIRDVSFACRKSRLGGFDRRLDCDAECMRYTVLFGFSECFFGSYDFVRRPY